MAEVKRLHTPEGTPPSHSTLVTPDHSHQVMQVLRQLYKSGELCDYTIVSEGQSFPAHKVILAATSDYFRAMLTGQMMEARQDHIDLKGVTAIAVQVLLNFAYTGKMSLNMDEVGEILAGACHLQMKSAIELCSQFLCTELAAKSCVDILNMAEMFSLCKVKRMAMEFAMDNFEKIAESDQFGKLQVEHLATFLQSDIIKVQSELAVFNHVLRWIEHDMPERSHSAATLFQHIRFSLMKPEELVDKISRTHFMTSNSSCRVFLDEALHYQLLPNRQPLMQTQRTQVRNQPCMVAFGGRHGLNIGYKFNCNKMFAFNEGKWYQLPSSESNFLYAAVVVLDNFMYVCGGMGKPAHARATCQRFDPRTGTWTRIAHMNKRRQSFPLVAHNGRLYALGGGTPGIGFDLEHPPTDHSEVYSIAKNEWSQISSLPAKLKSCSACVYRDQIYVSGGRTDSETTQSLYLYNIEKDTWEEKSPMLLPHAGHAMLAVKDKIFVIDRAHIGIEAYIPSTDDWVKIALPSLPLSGVARPAVMGHWVYFISYLKESKDYQCRRFNVLTLASEDLPVFPEKVHCVIGAPLTIPHSFLVDLNNNPGCV